MSKNHKLPCLGILLASFCSVLSSTAGYLVKLLPLINPVQVVGMRALIRLLVYSLALAGKQESANVIEHERVFLFLRALIGFVATTAAYMSYRILPLGDASTIIFSTPVFVSVLARIFLNEKIDFPKACHLMLAVCGITLIARPRFLFMFIEMAEDKARKQLELDGVLMALFAALGFALEFIFIKKLRETPVEVIVFWLSIGSVTSAAITMLTLKLTSGIELKIPSTVNGGIYLFSVCFIGVITQPLNAIAVKLEEASVISLTRSLDVVMAFLYQQIMMTDEIRITSVIGALLICGGSILGIIRRIVQDKAKRDEK